MPTLQKGAHCCNFTKARVGYLLRRFIATTRKQLIMRSRTDITATLNSHLSLGLLLLVYGQFRCQSAGCTKHYQQEQSRLFCTWGCLCWTYFQHNHLAGVLCAQTTYNTSSHQMPGRAVYVYNSVSPGLDRQEQTHIFQRLPVLAIKGRQCQCLRHRSNQLPASSLSLPFLCSANFADFNLFFLTRPSCISDLLCCSAWSWSVWWSDR